MSKTVNENNSTDAQEILKSKENALKKIGKYAAYAAPASLAFVAESASAAPPRSGPTPPT